MTHTEYRKTLLGEASNSAEDVKGNASYAAYAFAHGNEDEGRNYVRRIEENLTRLKSHLYSLDHVNRQIASDDRTGS